MPWIFFLGSVWSFCLMLNIFRPRRRTRVGIFFGFIAAWFSSELVLQSMLLQVIFMVVCIRFDSLQAWPGTIGLFLSILTLTGFFLNFLQAKNAKKVLERSLGGKITPFDSGLINTSKESLSWQSLINPFWFKSFSLKKTKNILYHRIGGINLRLDIYQHSSEAENCPVLLTVHGGAWVYGDKKFYGLPLMAHLASKGWICVGVNYRLSPRATFPEHLVDIKRAIAWVREHIKDYGGNPDFIAMSGGSAGGHLSSLAALTANDPAYQVGFESVDTSIQACVSLYGVYDLTDRSGPENLARMQLLEQSILKASMETSRESFESFSPKYCIHEKAPPFFIIHGTLDNLVPVGEVREFSKNLREKSQEIVCYAELPGAHHAFDLIPSIHTLYTTWAIEKFLMALYIKHQLSAED